MRTLCDEWATGAIGCEVDEDDSFMLSVEDISLAGEGEFIVVK